jgi:hypothetical protein
MELLGARLLKGIKLRLLVQKVNHLSCVRTLHEGGLHHGLPLSVPEKASTDWCRRYFNHLSLQREGGQ